MDQELVQYLDARFNGLATDLNERFGRIEQRLDSHDQRFDRIERRLDGHDQRFESIDRQFMQVNQRIDDRFEEVKRHTGVLVEDLRRQIQLVAEGLTMHVQVQHVQEREYFERKFDETQALFRATYGDLRHRVENLERDQN